MSVIPAYFPYFVTCGDWEGTKVTTREAEVFWSSCPDYRMADMYRMVLYFGKRKFWVVMAKVPKGKSPEPVRVDENLNWDLEGMLRKQEELFSRKMGATHRVVFCHKESWATRYFCMCVEKRQKVARKKAFLLALSEGDGSVDSQWSVVFGGGS